MENCDFMSIYTDVKQFSFDLKYYNTTLSGMCVKYSVLTSLPTQSDPLCKLYRSNNQPLCSVHAWHHSQTEFMDAGAIHKLLQDSLWCSEFKPDMVTLECPLKFEEWSSTYFNIWYSQVTHVSSQKKIKI